MLSVEFELTEEDLLAFNRYHNAHSRTVKEIRRKAYLMLLLLAVLLGLLILINPETWSFAGTVGLAFILVVAVLMALPSFRRGQVNRMARRLWAEGGNQALLERQTMSITAEGITKDSPNVRSLIRWPGVGKIVTTDAHAFFYFSALSAYVVPRRAFPDDADFENFVAAAREFHAAARPQDGDAGGLSVCPR